MDKLRAIKFFCRIAEAKSFAAAAHDLDIVPSVLSKTIAALEADIGFQALQPHNASRHSDRGRRAVL